MRINIGNLKIEFLSSFLLGIKKKESIVIAVSGGSDSVALLIIVNYLINNLHINIEIFSVTIDHGLREDSFSESLLVNKLVNKFNIKHTIIRIKIENASKNTQIKARNARYNALVDYCNKIKSKYLLTAHTKDDLLETIFLNLERGNQFFGLKGIRAKSKIQNIRLIRPILNISKVDLKNFLIINKIEWIEDPSNQNIKYRRVICRNMIENFNKKSLQTNCDNFWNNVKDGIIKNEMQNQEKIDFLNLYTKKCIKKLAKTEENAIFIDLIKFKKLHKIIKLRFLSILIGKLSDRYCHLDSMQILEKINSPQDIKNFQMNFGNTKIIVNQKMIILTVNK